jgi:small subunit ribosomal protein S13
MARIAGVDLPGRKHLVIALQYIYGIGPAKAKEICEKTGISPTKKSDDLDDSDIKKI